MRLLLFNKNEHYVGSVSSKQTLSHKEEINAENTMLLTTTDLVEKGDRLVYKDHTDMWQEFIVRSVDENRDGGPLIREVFAEHSISEILGDYIEDTVVTNLTAKNALGKALEPTRWTVGSVNVDGQHTTHFFNMNAREALQELVEVWGGELQYRIQVVGSRIVNRYVDLLVERGYHSNRRFTYSKNLENIKRTVNDDDVITALYGFGEGKEIILNRKKMTKHLDFASINNGKMYVADEAARATWGRVDGSSKAHVFGRADFDDCRDRAELLRLTQEELGKRSVPRVTYEATVFDLARMDSRYETIRLGDTLQLADKEFKPELRISARVVAMEQDLIDTQNTKIILGNYIPTIDTLIGDQSQAISDIQSRRGIYDDAQYNYQHLQQQIDELKDEGGGGVSPEVLAETFPPRLDLINGYRLYTNPAAFYTGLSSVTGAILIEIAPGNVMIDGLITLRSYYDLAHIVFGGYTYTGTTNWHLPDAIGHSSKAMNVRFASTEDERRFIILGDVTTSWSYLHVAIPRIGQGYGGGMDASKFKISMITDITAYNVSKTIIIN